MILVSYAISGIVGVLLGSVIELIYINKLEKKHLKDDYKKICVAEWIAFMNQTMELINEPKIYNHIIFNQYIDQKKLLLYYIAKNKKTEKLIEKIEEKKDTLSLGDYAEKALNTKDNSPEKAKLMRAVAILVKDVIKEVYDI